MKPRTDITEELRMDIAKELQVIKNTGKALTGTKECLRAILQLRAKLVVLAGDCPANATREIMIASKISDVITLKTDVSASDLGMACGKPFPVAVVAVTDPGSSSLLEEVSRTVG